MSESATSQSSLASASRVRNGEGVQLLPLLLAALTVGLGFEAGGYFADTTGWVAAGLALALGAGALARGRPPAGATRPLLLCGGALALFALWTLLSGTWSGAPARALIEFDRVLLYLLVLLLFATARSPESVLRRLPVAFALGALVLCAAGLFVRTLPETWPFGLPPLGTRMDYPLGYSNALGALAAVGLVLSLHVASWRGEHPAVRGAAAGALPILAAALVLTFSRGALAAARVGLLVYLLLGPGRGVVTALLATAAPVALAVERAYGADRLSDAPRSAEALAQGEELALMLGLAALVATSLLVLLMPIERRLQPLHLPRGRPRIAILAVALALAAGGTFAMVTVGSTALDGLRDRVVADGSGREGRPTRERLTSPIDVQEQSRPKYWRVSLENFFDRPLAGSGAGTFAKLWARDRPLDEDVTEGHSLYLETLAELGMVGGVLLVVTLVGLLAPFVARLRRRSQTSAAVLAAAAVWLVHAGLDWDWEMPVLTLWLFAMAGCALAASPRRLRRQRWGWPSRLLAAGACALAAVTPVAVALSQQRIDTATEAFRAGRCDDVGQSARAATATLSARPEPYALLAYCNARQGEHRLALRQIEQAMERDRDNWELTYGLAIVRGAAGLDPRPAARRARRLNPLEQLTIDAVDRFSGNKPARWRRQARLAPLPIPAGS